MGEFRSAVSDAVHDQRRIRHWREQRQRLQLNLEQTVCRGLQGMSSSELDQHLGRLCNDLMDYLATGHGSVYSRYCSIPNRCSAHAGKLPTSERQRLQQEIWLHLGRTTDAALRFNLRCETTPPAALQQKLHSELGKLNKTLTLRFALEEQLLELGSAG